MTPSTGKAVARQWLAGRWWAIKMLFLWRYRLGYWDWRTFVAAWKHA